MASFSFGAGNAAKLARIPLYAAGRLATLVIPRSRDEWVFGCGAGIGDGALALWQRVAADARPAVWLTGSDSEAADASALGIPHVRRMSWRGFWCTSRARVIVVTHGFGDVNRYAVSGAFVAQLWHGIPLKRIGLDSPETLRSSILPRSRLLRRALGAMYRGAARQIDLLPAASPLVRGRLESAFGLPDARVPVTGEPRVDVLSMGTPGERRERARAVLARAGLPPLGDSRLVLYAPTWRDGEPDPAIPTPAQWRQLIEMLEARDAVLLVRSHPLGAGDYEPPFATDRVLALGSSRLRDATPALPALSALITDYSSMAFDASLVPLPVLFLAPDVEEYARRRGFYGRFSDVAGTDPGTTWDDTVAQLDALLADPVVRAERIARAADLSASVHTYRDGENTARVYRAILNGAQLHSRVPEHRKSTA
ncbi:putative glycosyl/glycerophosphate transferase [Microbacterium sp. C448]|uniref:CDP-glycerol glycerophosphotransferase family protein n=1 Tax=Microbacterium TaxID=33882 RepID=UPI0003DE583A|nr:MULTISPECIES: CDP-glycerol glycerophosphotransferase family protein [Microbacterium]CDK01261.1 putative glycosyl/glycerophosphate transferase [Microbacterium sp. C448]